MDVSLHRLDASEGEAVLTVDAPASERAYRRLKADILAGRLPFGPLDIKILSDLLRMSVTPVREALSRLCAERLVKQAPHYGFIVAMPSPLRLEHLYDLSGRLLHMCLGPAAGRRKTSAARSPPQSGVYAEDVAALFQDIAFTQPNSALAESILALNDQLCAARRMEPHVLAGASDELARLLALWRNGNIADLRLRLRDYHRTRFAHVDMIARLLNADAAAVR